MTKVKMYWYLINDRILIAEVKYIMLFINIQKLTINIRKVMITMKTPPNRQILVPRTSRECSTPTSPKDPIWASSQHPELTSRECPNLTPYRSFKMTSRGRPNPTSKGRSVEIDSGRFQCVLRSSSTQTRKHVFGTMWGHLLDVPKFHFTFLWELVRLTKSI